MHLVAFHTPSLLAQSLLYHSSQKSVRAGLAANANLHPSIWDKLYETNTYPPPPLHPDVRELSALLSNAPTSDRVAKILRTRDDRVINPALRVGIKNLSAQDALNLASERKISSERAALLLLSKTAPQGLALHLFKVVRKEALRSEDSRVHPNLGGEAYGEALAGLSSHYQVLSPQKVAKLLDELEDEDLLYKYFLCYIIDYRPEVLPHLLNSKHLTSYASSIAAAQHLTPDSAHKLFDLVTSSRSIGRSVLAQVLEAASNNPSIPYRLRYKALNELKTQRLDYGMSSEALGVKLAKYRTYDAVAIPPVIGGWSNAGAAHLADVHHLVAERCSFYPSLLGSEMLDTDLSCATDTPASAQYIKNTLTPYLDTLGQVGWELFIALLPEWRTSIDSLLEVITSTALVH